MKTKKKSLFAWFGRTVAVGLVPLMLFGCANNSDNDDDNINGNVVNANPPQFSTDPSAGNTITGTSVLKVSFNEAVTGVTNGTNVVLKNGSGIVASMDHTAPTSGNTYTFDPNPDLTSGTYYLTVGAGTDIVDGDKQAATPSTVVFTVDDARTTAKAAMNAASITAAVVTAADTAAAAVTNNLMSVIPAAMGAGIAAATDNATKQSVISSLIGSANGAASLTSSADRTITRINDSTGFTTLLQLIGDTLTAQAVAGNLSAAELQSAITTVNTALTAAGADTDQLSGLQSGFNTAISGDVSSSTLGTEFSTAVSTATGVTSSGTTVTGTTYTLATGIDTTTGTANNDLFIGIQSATASEETFSVTDTINGGAGTDTFELTSLEGAGVNAATISGIEILNYRATVAAGNLDMDNWLGVTALKADRFTGATDVSNIALTTSLNIETAAANTDSTFTWKGSGVTGSSDNTTVTLNGIKAGADVELAGAIETVNIVTTGASSSIADLDLDAGTTTVNINADEALTVTNQFTMSGATSLTITGDSLVTLPAIGGNVATLNASGMTAGGISATLNALATITATGSVGNDSFTTGAALTTGSVNAGNGTDTLTIAASAHLTSTIGAKYTGFETLGVADGQTVDMDHISGITAVVVTDSSSATTVNDMTSTHAGAVTFRDLEGAVTLAVKNASNVGQLDSISITTDDGDTTTSEDISGTAGTITMAGVETLTVTAVDDAEITQSAAASGSLNSIILRGAGDHTFTTGDMAVTNVSINASSSTGTNVIDASSFATNGIAITAGTGTHTITGSDQADIITGGTGNDAIQGNDGIDTITLSTGNDDVIIDDDDAVDTVAGFTGGGATDDIIFDVTALNTELGQNLIDSSGDVTDPGTADAVVIHLITSGDTDAAGAVDAGANIVKFTNTTGINAFANLSFSLTLDANAGNTGDAILAMYWDADDAVARIGYMKDAGINSDANFANATTTFVELVTLTGLSTTEYTALVAGDFGFQ